jgi:hypothetical protein
LHIVISLSILHKHCSALWHSAKCQSTHISLSWLNNLSEAVAFNSTWQCLDTCLQIKYIRFSSCFTIKIARARVHFKRILKIYFDEKFRSIYQLVNLPQCLTGRLLSWQVAPEVGSSNKTLCFIAPLGVTIVLTAISMNLVKQCCAALVWLGC